MSAMSPEEIRIQNAIAAEVAPLRRMLADLQEEIKHLKYHVDYVENVAKAASIGLLPED